MDKKIKHEEFVQKLASKLDCDVKEASYYLKGFVDTLYDCIEEKSSVTIQNFGNFYVSKKRDSTVFKFNPSQKMKYILGWASSYKPKL